MPKHHISDGQRLLAASSYLMFLFVIPYTVGHSNPFVYKHAKQGLSLFVLEIMLMAVAVVPVLGWFVAAAGWLFVVVNATIGIGHALAGKEWEVPVFGTLADHVS